MTKFLNISTDDTLGGNSPSDEVVSSQKALKTYIDNNGGGTTYTAGTGIDITSNTISVTAPTLTNTATGSNSITIGGNTTAAASATNIGYNSSANGVYSVAFGRYASVSSGNGGVAIGYGATVWANNACQINTSTSSKNNFDANTYKFANANGNFEVMSADGTIPTDRFTTTPSADGTYVPTLTIASGVATRSWGSGGGGSVAWGNISGTLSDQTDLNTALSGKQATITGAASSVVTNNLAAARAVITDGSGKLAASSTTSTEIGYVSGVTSAIQTQLNNKQATLTAGNGIDITSNVISVGDIDCGTLS